MKGPYISIWVGQYINMGRFPPGPCWGEKQMLGRHHLDTEITIYVHYYCPSTATHRIHTTKYQNMDIQIPYY